jgi:hypothetical protein
MIPMCAADRKVGGYKHKPICAIPLIAIALFLTALIAPMPSAIAQELKLSRGQLEVGEAENVPELSVTKGIGLDLNLVSLDDQVEAVKSADESQVVAERFGKAVNINPTPEAELGRQTGVSVILKSGKILRFLVLVQKEDSAYSVIDILPSSDQSVIAAASPPLDPAPAPPSNLLQVPKVPLPTGKGGPVVLPPPPFEEAVEIPVPTPASQLVSAKPAAEDEASIADKITTGLPLAVKAGKIELHSAEFAKVQKAIALLRFGRDHSLKQVAKQVDLKPSVLSQLQEWGDL